MTGQVKSRIQTKIIVIK